MSSRSTYIPALDGLRTVSVTLVLLFHAGLSMFKAGFIGVDVFFAISGFIISKLIYTELEEGTFSLLDFLKRRVARLMPALIVTVIFTMLAGYFLLGPVAFDELSQSAAAALLSVSNIHFWLGSGYFDDASQAKPLLHTWSLGVEEQFYLFWPLFLIFAYKIGRFTGLIALISVVSTISIGGQLFIETNDPSAAFFLTPLRIYQFGLGALIALTGVSVKGLVGNCLTVAALVALIAISVLAHEDSGLLIVAVAPVVAASLAFASLDAPLAKLILGNRVMTFVGKRAYSIYLAHWPLMVFWPEDGTLGSPFFAIPATLVFSFLLGELLHRIVERPVRITSSTTAKRRETALWSTPIVLSVCVGICAFVIAGRGFPGRFSNELASIEAAAVDDRRQIYAEAQPNACNFGDKATPSLAQVLQQPCTSIDNTKINILLIGDSFAADAFPGLQAATRDSVKWSAVTLAACAPMVGGNSPGTHPDARHLRKNCKDVNVLQREVIEQRDYDVVLLMADWSGRDWLDLELALEYLDGTGKHVGIIGRRPSFEVNLSKDLNSFGSVRDVNERLATFLRPWVGVANEKIREITKNHKAIFIDVLPGMCGESCRGITKDGKLMYSDQHHLTFSGSKELANVVLQNDEFTQLLTSLRKK